ncbi:hypothetical protein Tco_1390827, partial [Tanacetum coccineum]
SYLHAAVESLQAVETLQWENILTVYVDPFNVASCDGCAR